MKKRQIGWLALAALFAVASYAGYAALTGDAGYPLDDAWIHQTYARNMAVTGHWEYTPGAVSSGSTAPLWTLLLALGYVIRVPYMLWSHFLGWLSLLGLAFGSMRVWQALWPESSRSSWLAGLTIIGTWPLIWAAVSGMETLLYAAAGLWIVALFLEYRVDPAGLPAGGSFLLAAGNVRQVTILGIMSGLMILIRPDGLALWLLIAVGLLLVSGGLHQRFTSLLLFGLTTALPLIPYLIFNLNTSGTLWPNTFYAKQAEYAAVLARPLLARLAQLLFFSLGGPEQGWQGTSSAHLFLLPGLVAAAWTSLQHDWRRRRLRYLLPLLWAGGHVLLYAWRLPVTYQHGRYLFAALPVWVLFGWSGWVWLSGRLGQSRLTVLARLAAKLTFLALAVVFFFLGMQAYAADVAFINGEMVDVAHWVNENTPADALIAAHDIGALGYFAERPILDLAGLITPEVIPWLADEAAMDRYILDSDAKFLVTAPGWPYEGVVSAKGVDLLYSTGYEWTKNQGANNMMVYRLVSN